jgi:WD40 repeat protein
VLPLGSREREGFTSFDAWDYFHINSVDKNADGDYLISGRHVSAIYKLNGKTGDIIWQIGGKHSNFSFGDELEFAFQHDARFRGREENVEYISLFDNGAGSNGHQGGDKGKIRDYSTGKLLKLNTSDWTASIVQEVIHPDRILGASQGNTQILPNGNFFVNWGQAGTITEFRANDSVPIFNAYLDSDLSGDGVQNYRGFRYNWTGQPNEPPAIVALKSDKDEVEIYVSWNGDTETRTWRFYALQGDIKHDLGEQKRRSFETRFVLQKKELSIGRDTRFFAEALGSDGRPLSRTDATSVRPFISSNTNQWYGDNQLFLGEL